MTCGQKVTNIDRFSHGRNFFFSVYLFCFVLFRCFLLLFFAPSNSSSFSYACMLITFIEAGDSNEDHCFYYDLTIILFCTFFIRVA